jgi:hypothetical protein
MFDNEFDPDIFFQEEIEPFEFPSFENRNRIKPNSSDENINEMRSIISPSRSSIDSLSSSNSHFNSCH